MKLEKEDIDYLCNLAGLEPQPESQERLQRDLAAIFNYMEILEAVETSDVAPLNHVHGSVNVLRSDFVVESLDRTETLKLAPESDDEYFLVPKVIDNNQ